MVYVLWLLTGILVGWSASFAIRTDGPRLLLNVIVAIAGSFVVGWLVDASPGSFSLVQFASTVLGAGAVVAAVNLIWHPGPPPG